MMCLGDTPTKYIGTWLELFPSLSTRCCFSSLPILDNFDENVSHPIYPRRFCIKYFHFHCFSVDEFFCTYWMSKYFLMQEDYLIFFCFSHNKIIPMWFDMYASIAYKTIHGSWIFTFKHSWLSFMQLNSLIYLLRCKSCFRHIVCDFCNVQFWFDKLKWLTLFPPCVCVLAFNVLYSRTPL